jgi:uncharacterized membrane protein YeiH
MVFYALDLVGVAVFALSGALAAGRAGLSSSPTPPGLPSLR